MTERPTYCCGTCPGIHSGGYDCTCLFTPKCPQYNTLYGAQARLKAALLQPFIDINEKIATWNWKRKKRKRWNFKGHDD